MAIRGKAPLRISFAGGGTDLSEVFGKYGGKIINTTINKYIHGTIEKRKDKRIFINKVSLNKSDEFTRRIIRRIKPKIGVNFNYYNDIPPGRGLGSSSTYSVLLTRLISELQGKIMDDNQIVETVYGIESEVGMCGWQDQYAATIGGFNFIEFGKEKKIYPFLN